MISYYQQSFSILLLLLNISFHGIAQADMQTSILTEYGIMTVSKTTDGKDMICFGIAIWDEMQKGTSYTSRNLPEKSSRQFCIEIAGKHKHACRSGIGFSCSVYECPGRTNRIASIVDASNRLCSVMLQRPNRYTLLLIFLDNVNWESLQNEP